MAERRNRHSLSRRLLVLALVTVVAVWVAAAAFTYHDARKEMDEILDAHLAQSASLLTAQASRDPAGIGIEEHAPLLHKYSRRVAFQIWERGQTLRLHSANAPAQLLSDNTHGFSDNIIDGQRWRVFSTWDDSGKYLIQVAESTQEREELARAIAANLLKPLWLSLPLLALLLWFAVASGLRPLVSLTNELASREPDSLGPLDAGTAPREVVPLIERLNQLFARIEASLQKERRFTADAAHELRTPVAAIKAQAQVARGATTDAERVHALDNAILGCDRAAHLIDQLLTLARIDAVEPGTTESCPLRALAAEVAASIAPAALSQNVDLEVAEGDEVSIQGNRALLRILLRNLIDNAARHTHAGTTVRVEVAREPGICSLSVLDDGPGIPTSELERISERFYRPPGTKASGSGLGLSIVKRIAELHGASMRITARDNGQGLNVTVTFKA